MVERFWTKLIVAFLIVKTVIFLWLLFNFYILVPEYYYFDVFIFNLKDMILAIIILVLYEKIYKIKNE